jgi:hypothetical protein
VYEQSARQPVLSGRHRASGALMPSRVDRCGIRDNRCALAALRCVHCPVSRPDQACGGDARARASIRESDADARRDPFVLA